MDGLVVICINHIISKEGDNIGQPLIDCAIKMHMGLDDPKSFYVYRFLDENQNVIYIGKTRQLRNRVWQHLHNKSNIPYEGIKQVYNIEYIEFETECDMSIVEIYLINYYKPQYNTDSKGDLGKIHIDIPNKWIQLNIHDNIIPSKNITYDDDIYLQYEYSIKFNKELFTNEQLTTFINTHENKELTDDDLKILGDICNIKTLNIIDINNKIVYNNSKAHIVESNNGYILKIEKKGECGFGSLFKYDNMLMFKIHVDNNRKAFKGVTRVEIANQVDNYLRNLTKYKTGQ